MRLQAGKGQGFPKVVRTEQGGGAVAGPDARSERGSPSMRRETDCNDQAGPRPAGAAPSRMRTGGGCAAGAAFPRHPAPGARACGGRWSAQARCGARLLRAAAPPSGGPMELEAARRAVLAAVRGTCAADLPRLLHWMRNTSKRGPDRALRSQRRRPAGGGAPREGSDRRGRPRGRCGPEPCPAGASGCRRCGLAAPFRCGSGTERAAAAGEGGGGVPPVRSRARAGRVPA